MIDLRVGGAFGNIESVTRVGPSRQGRTIRANSQQSSKLKLLNKEPSSFNEINSNILETVGLFHGLRQLEVF